VKKIFCLLAVAVLAAGCNSSGTTASIAVDRADGPVRKACPAFRKGEFAPDSSRTYGVEQITTFQNGSAFNCRCVVKASDATPNCQQVRRFVLGDIES
jgi:hypothetical protein